MKRLRIQEWGFQCRAPRIQSSSFSCKHRPTPRYAFTSPAQRRLRSSVTAPRSIENQRISFDEDEDDQPIRSKKLSSKKLSQEQNTDDKLPSDPFLRSPPPSVARNSAKLSALHARLSLPTRFPLETLARTLTDPSSDPHSDFNNTSFALLGNDLLGYFAAEHILCHYPRLPISVLFAAQWGYVGPHTLTQMAHEWGVEAGYPGKEVDPGYLRFAQASLAPGSKEELESLKEMPKDQMTLKRGMNWRILSDGQFGEKEATYPAAAVKEHKTKAQQTIREKFNGNPPTSLVEASNKFVQALVGALYLHVGRPAAKRFFDAHFLSRSLDISKLFDFKNPTQDLSRLCAREGFEMPVARLISETGRLSRHPVFVVGVYSGEDELGQAAGASLFEARTRAAAAALKSWYLYSPLDVTKPSSTEGAAEKGKWIPNIVDPGEVIA